MESKYLRHQDEGIFMFIFVRATDNVIVGCSVKPVNKEDMSRQGNKVYEVADSEFDYKMIGQKLQDFKTV